MSVQARDDPENGRKTANPMDEKLDRIVESLHQLNINFEGLRISLSSLIQNVEDHEKRIRNIEGWKQNLTPILTVFTFIAGVVLTEMLDRFF